MRYAELHCKSNFSFLEGASFADELVQRAAELKLHALAVTDRNSLAGVVRAHVAAKQAGVKLLVGAEIGCEASGVGGQESGRVLLYAVNRAGYGRLARLITVGRRRAEKGSCSLRIEDVAGHAEGLIAVLVPPMVLAGEMPAAGVLREAFGARLYAAVEAHRGQRDAARVAEVRAWSQRFAVPLVAANDVHYHVAARRRLQDVLVCIREGCSLEEAGYRLFPNGERHLKSAAEMLEVLDEEWIERTAVIADACSFSLDELRYEYPEELTPPGETPAAYLAGLTWSGARGRWPEGVPEKVRAQLAHELALIHELKYEAYFLTVYDLVKFARSREILCQGRGSAANSAVCYCLGITSVDPARSNVLFERFISRERDEAPDIDVDFEHARREEVMQYVYEKYGRERAGIVAEVISYRPKSAARDVGKALGMSLDLVEKLAGMMDRFDDSKNLPKRIQEAGIDASERTMRQFSELTREILGFPRHLSQHVGGFVITHGPLCELVPIENATMEGRTVIEWDKDDIDALGILKVDCLALGMLTCIHTCFDLIRAHDGRDLTLATVPAEDPAVYEMCCHADTVGVFQIESRAQMAMLPRLKPRCFYDLVIEVSIVRPGPIQGGMVHPYLRRRAGEEAVTFPNEALRDVLGNTLGVPLFQEQVMRLAVVAAGFTGGEADQLRRAMGAWRRTGKLETMQEKFLAGMAKNGYAPAFAAAVFEQIKGFGEYGFPESHAASFALLVYASAWIKLHYPAAFLAGLLNSQPMGFYAPAQLVRDAQNHGVTVLPVDVNLSAWASTIESENTVRLGFSQVRGIQFRQHIEPLMRARTVGPTFKSLFDLVQRSGLTQAALALLAKADAFNSIGLDRRAALWQVLNQHAELPLFKGMEVEETEPSLNAMPLQEHVAADYRNTGLSLKAHPVSFVRASLARINALPCAALKNTDDGAFVCVAGIVLVRQRPDTAAGVIFITLEDETGQANVIVWPAVFDRHHKAARGAAGLVIRGKLQRVGEVIHVVAQQISDMREFIPELTRQSRDFH